MRKFVSLILFPCIIFALSVGTISEKPSKKYRVYREFAKYLERKLKEMGIDEAVKVRFGKDIPHARKLVEEGQIDVFIDSIYPSLKVCLNGLCEPSLLRWKNAVRSYRSLIIVRRDSGISKPKNLVGRKIAFDSPFSTTGYFVPYVMLLEMGFRLVRLESPEEEVPKCCIGYVFAGGEENVVGWVLFRKVDAGALHDVSFRSIVKDKAHEFRIVFKSHPVPRHIVSFSGRVRGKLKHALIDILTRMHEDEEGKRVLKMFDNTLKFEPLSEKDIGLLKKFEGAIRKYGI